MAVTAEDIKMRIVAENAADRAVKQFATSVGKVDKKVSKLGGSLKALSGLALGAFAVQGIRKMNDFVGDSIKLAQAQQDAEKKVADVIRATGNAAGYTAEQIKAMASSLQNQTKYGDEAILEMQSILLTFKNVSGDVFSGASMAVLDMATVMQTDLKSAAIQLGKALNDPVLGASAMSRAGIQFTEAQKEMMKEMVATNRIAEAQKMILDEIAGQMGGTAAGAADTYSGKLQQLSNKYGDLREDIGEAVMDSGAFDRVLGTLNPAVDELTRYIATHKDDIGDFAEGLAGMAIGAAKGAKNIADDLTPSVIALAAALGKVMGVVDAVPGGWATLMGAAAGGRVAGAPGALIVGGVAATVSPVYNWAVDFAKENPGLPFPATSPFAFKSKLYDGDIESPFRGDSQIKERMGYSPEKLEKAVEEAAKAAKKAAEEQKKLGNASGNTAEEVAGLGSATGDAERKQREAAKALEDAEQWYRKEYEVIEGLTDAENAHSLAVDNLTLLYNKGKISFDELKDGVDDAALKLDMFEASMDGVLQADIKSMVKNRPDLFGDFSKREYRVLGQSLSLNDDEKAYLDTGLEKADKQVEALYMIGDSLENMGYDLKGAGNFASAIEQLTLASRLGGISGADPTKAYVQGIGNLLMGAGSVIGGDVGDALASASGMAMTGFEIGGPVGAAIGGVVGLVGSIIGGGSDDTAVRDEARRAAYDTLLENALSGGDFSYNLLKEAGWEYGSVANYRVPYELAGKGVNSRLLEDRAEGGAARLVRFANAMDEVSMAMDSVMVTSFASDIEQLAIKYEYLSRELEGHASVLEAERAEMAAAVLGVTADNMTTMFDAAIETAEDADHAGRMIAESLEMQIVESFKKMAISHAINETVMPMLQPVLNELVAGALSGGLSAGEMADLVLQAQEIAASVAPAVGALYGAFDEAGVINYTYSSTPVEGRAYGGPVIANRPYIVGELGIPELFVPSSNGRILPGNDLGGNRPIQVIVQVGNYEFESIIQNLADRVFVRAERRKGVVNAQPLFG